MKNEDTELSDVALFIAGIVDHSSADERKLILAAYEEARLEARTMSQDEPGLRIDALLQQFDRVKKSYNIASCGWLLAALQERLVLDDLIGRQSLMKMVDDVAGRLLRSEQDGYRPRTCAASGNANGPAASKV